MVAWGKEWLRVNSGQVSWPLCTFPRSLARVTGISEEEVDGSKTLKSVSRAGHCSMQRKQPRKAKEGH